MVHQYKLNGYNIILDTASGSVHTVDEVAYDIIGMYKTHTPDEIVEEIMKKYGHLDDVNESEILECLEDIRSLEEAGKLFSVDEYEGLATNFKNNSKVVKALCLHVAHTCNLNCSYCFASQGKYQGDRALMSFEVGKRALDFIMENSGTRRNLEVDFFGGEPSLNFDVVKRLVEYARSVEGERGKNFRFTYTTNGMILTDEMIEFLNKECHNVVLSLDGRKEVNDHFRVDYTGKGSYDTIVPNFKKLVESRGGKGYYVRGTYTHNNVDFTNDIFHMADLGFTELSMEPVVCPPGDPYALTEEDLPKLFEQYEILAKEMIKRKSEGRPFTFYHYMLDLKHGKSGCSPGTYGTTFRTFTSQLPIKSPIGCNPSQVFRMPVTNAQSSHKMYNKPVLRSRRIQRHCPLPLKGYISYLLPQILLHSQPVTSSKDKTHLPASRR